MSALRLVDEHGQVHGADAIVEELEERVAALQRELTTKLGMITKLRKDKVRERRKHPRRGEIVSIWAEWQVECKHPNSGLTDDRFDAILAILETRDVGHGREGFAYKREHFSRAIAGAKYDPFVTRHKNGREQRHDDISKICEGGKSFESFANRAPRGWLPPESYPIAPAPKLVEA